MALQKPLHVVLHDDLHPVKHPDLQVNLQLPLHVVVHDVLQVVLHPPLQVPVQPPHFAAIYVICGPISTGSHDGINASIISSIIVDESLNILFPPFSYQIIQICCFRRSCKTETVN